MNLRVGTSGFSYPAWKGSFYPEQISADEMLMYYSLLFNTVEINQTFMAMPTPDRLQGWADNVGDDFRFVLKAPRQITQNRRLRDVDELVARFIAAARLLERRLGPLLFQLHPTHKKDAERLATFLKLIPKDCRVALEFRHQSWFDDETFGIMRDHQASLCLAEADTDLEVPFVSTADWGYVRLRQAEYGDAELTAWLQKIRQQSWSDAYVFFRHEDEGRGPMFGSRLLELSE